MNAQSSHSGARLLQTRSDRYFSSHSLESEISRQPHPHVVTLVFAKIDRRVAAFMAEHDARRERPPADFAVEGVELERQVMLAEFQARADQARIAYQHAAKGVGGVLIAAFASVQHTRNKERLQVRFGFCKQRFEQPAEFFITALFDQPACLNQSCIGRRRGIGGHGLARMRAGDRTMMLRKVTDMEGLLAGEGDRNGRELD